MADVDDTRKRMLRIWATVTDVPRGNVASYGQVAEVAGIRRGARQVGYALRHLDDGMKVPWHRIVQSTGRIAFAEGSDQFNEQKKRLAAENVIVRKGRVDMTVYRWQTDLDEFLWKPSDAWDGDEV